MNRKRYVTIHVIHNVSNKNIESYDSNSESYDSNSESYNSNSESYNFNITDWIS
jgi:hypothetical protein